MADSQAQERLRYWQALHQISREAHTAAGEEFLARLTCTLAEAIEADYVMVGQLVSHHAQPETELVRSLAVAERNGKQAHPTGNFTYAYAGTPCEQVIRKQLYVVGRGLPQIYPNDGMLRDQNIEAYAGIPLRCSRGSPQGLLMALFRRPLERADSDRVREALEVFGLHSATEVERLRNREQLQQSQYFAEVGFHNSPLAMLIIDRTGRVRRVNRTFREHFGLFEARIRNTDVQALFPQAEKEKVAQCLQHLLEQQATHLALETRLLDSDFASRDIMLDAYALNDLEGRVRNIVFQIEDIAEKKTSEREIRKLLRSIESSPVATVITDRDANIEYTNRRFTELTGFNQEEALGQKPNINSSGETPQETYEVMWKTLQNGEQWQGELLNQRKDGSLYWARTTIFPILDGNGNIENYVSLQEDFSEARSLSKRLQYEATHDQLTGLINRREFQRRLEDAIARANTDLSTHALCFLDLDQFKLLNDTAGHLAGDALLTRIGQTLLNKVRRNDTAARLGGDEFAVILTDCGIDKAREIAMSLRDAIASINFPWEDRVYTVGVSVGITRINGDITDPVELIKQVDAACYSSKESGRSSVTVYRPDDVNMRQRRAESSWVPQIRAALEQKRFRLYLQPITRLAQDSSTLPDYEVLVRLVDANGQIIAPGEFLPAAERYGLASAIDKAVFDDLYATLTQRPELRRSSGVFSVNLSGLSLTRVDLLEHIVHTIQNGDLDAGKFQFEVTETAAISNITDARRFMETLQDIGCRLVLDDFGRGLSSFAYLKNLPVNVLKIDGLFVREMLRNKDDHNMVRMINELAHSLQLETIAEYIESEEILKAVRELGIDYAQGYFIARPRDIDTIP